MKTRLFERNAMMVATVLTLSACGDVEDALVKAINDTSAAIVENQNRQNSPGEPEMATDANTNAGDETGADNEAENAAGVPDAVDETDASDASDASDAADDSEKGNELSFADDMLARVNAIRLAGAMCGDEAMPAVATLQWNPQLVDAAHGHNDFMQTTDSFSHEGLNGSTPSERLAQTGYDWRTMGENIAAGYPDTATVLAGWMSSAGHCRNIMNGAFEELGVDVIDGDNASYNSFWTMVLAAPRTSQ